MVIQNDGSFTTGRSLIIACSSRQSRVAGNAKLTACVFDQQSGAP